MTDLWPCSTCGAAGFRNVAQRGYCLAHWCALVASFDPAAIPERGIMLPTGADYGDGWWDCSCARCGATATMAPASPCPWCVRRLCERDVEQRQLLLRPELPDVDDARRDAAVEAWAARLARAVTAGIVDETSARRALDREVRRAQPA